MNKTWFVAQRELSGFVNTWMGYIIIAAALVVDGILFNAFAIGTEARYSSDVLADFFYFASGLTIVAGILLAMRLIAEDRQSGAIVLLYSSPISNRSIIYGKFLSAWIFSLVLHAVSLYMPALIMIHGKISMGHVLSGYIGLSLLGACVISMTLLSSTLASNQLVAGVGGGFVTVVFLILWMLAKKVDQPFRDVFSWLAIHSDHFSSFSMGIVHLKDLLFYLGISVFFLECSVSVLESKRSQG